MFKLKTANPMFLHFIDASRPGVSFCPVPGRSISQRRVGHALRFHTLKVELPRPRILCAGLLVTGIFLLGCAPGGEDEKSRLLETDRQFARLSVAAGAAEAFHEYLAPNATGMPEGAHPIRGREEIYKRMAPSQKSYTLAWEPQDGAVARSGELGYTWGLYQVIPADTAAGEEIEYGKYLNVWQKQPDGAWKVLYDIGNKSPAPH